MSAVCCVRQADWTKVNDFALMVSVWGDVVDCLRWLVNSHRHWHVSREAILIEEH